MYNYKLLTPGPLTTTSTVKEEMLFDRCTWDDDYKGITQKIRTQLLQLAEASAEQYTAVLMQGSGSFGVEAVMTTTVGKNDKCLIITNGAYGERIVTMAKYIGINYYTYSTNYDCLPQVEEIRNVLDRDKEITHIAMVHCETTTGILNPIEEVVKLAKEYGKICIIDAMSSFGAIPIKVEDLGIDYLISSANKCIQGVPGFSFVIANIKELSRCQGNSRSLCLDLYDQWIGMDKDGKWRYTSPTHVVVAFSKAIDELLEEGGVEGRYNRYRQNNWDLRQNLKEIGINAYIDEEVQSPIITSFIFPNNEFNFNDFYKYVKERGFVIYPGKLTEVDTFRIGNIGEIYEEDIIKLCSIIKAYIEGGKNE
ncbi:2-aminoethylphosphonate--pyruvate transaminase [Clostridium sporogenes]|uniref:2-aminoethylphosphonate--pyruvate transaminase n=1 Tax=Clostridium sporogenes TaxID=1509 RepID=UPI0015EF84A3|nr:2-aminoethylphosphonate--pyruvate transaminase [Clostridium sporogenes]MBA4508036.1 2-aminoethylphosphonate--pyruvate transaminase [Clostridium sporogenes]